MRSTHPASVPGVVDLERFAGAQARADAPADVLVEVPHGATTAAHFDALAAELVGPFPPDLRAFFFVNTDVGAPETARRFAARLVEAHPTRVALVARCAIPRTFVDCNRWVDPDAVGRATAAGEMTPGLASYVRAPADVALLRGRHATYRETVERLYEATCGAGGSALMLHSYAPRSIDVPVDDRIVERLRDAYRPETVGSWPLRPEADLITRTPEGERLASAALVEATQRALGAVGVTAQEGVTYPLHPSTLGRRLAQRWRGQTLCVELRRDLLADPFDPFAEMRISPAAADRLGAALAQAWGAWWADGAR